MEFPVYRKYINDKSYFEVHSETAFTELKSLPGNKWEINHFEAKNYFDRLYISQLIDNDTAHFIQIEPIEYQEVKSSAEKS